MEFLVFLILSVFGAYGAGTNSNLLGVLLVYRHGDRAPTDFTPNDIYQDRKYWRTEPGELTNRGKQQHYSLGSWLRRRYDNFLPSSYQKRDIYVRSSDADRCLMSAASNLAGLYPPVGDQVWNKDIHWMPIPIHTLPQKKDGLLKMGKACPGFKPLFDELLENDNFTAIDKENKELYDFLTEKTGEEVKKFRDIEKIFDTLTIEADYNLLLPDWTQHKLSSGVQVFPDEMKKWADLAYEVPTYTEDLARMGTGRFFDTLADQFDAVIKNDTKKMLASKMVMFSAHKSTVCDLLHTLGVFRITPYAGTLLFELRKEQGSKKVYVNTIFKADDDVEDLQLPGCEVDCPYENFLRIIKPYRLTEDEWKKECLSRTSALIVNSLLTTFSIVLTFVTRNS